MPEHQKWAEVQLPQKGPQRLLLRYMVEIHPLLLVYWTETGSGTHVQTDRWIVPTEYFICSPYFEYNKTNTSEIAF